MAATGRATPTAAASDASVPGALPSARMWLDERVDLGALELLNLHATGGMAEVYRARVRGADGSEQILAVKKILPQFTRDKDVLRMFLEEARIAALLDHPNIVRMLDVGAGDATQDRTGAAYYIVMEFADGKDLSDIIWEAVQRGERLPLGMTVQAARDVARALHHAWNVVGDDGAPLRLIHRDVSPHNVLVTWDGRIKLTDFGIAKVQAAAPRTQAGIIKGKIGYMSPEQARARPLDHRSDLFNIGILMYEALTGARLFHADSDVDTLEQMHAARVPRLDPALLVPAPLEAFLRRALARNPGDRPPDGAAFEAELLAAADESRVVPRPHETAHVMAHLFPALARQAANPPGPGTARLNLTSQLWGPGTGLASAAAALARSAPPASPVRSTAPAASPPPAPRAPAAARLAPVPRGAVQAGGRAAALLLDTPLDVPSMSSRSPPPPLVWPAASIAPVAAAPAAQPRSLPPLPASPQPAALPAPRTPAASRAPGVGAIASSRKAAAPRDTEVAPPSGPGMSPAVRVGNGARGLAADVGDASARHPAASSRVVLLPPEPAAHSERSLVGASPAAAPGRPAERASPDDLGRAGPAGPLPPAPLPLPLPLPLPPSLPVAPVPPSPAGLSLASSVPPGATAASSLPPQALPSPAPRLSLADGPPPPPLTPSPWAPSPWAPSPLPPPAPGPWAAAAPATSPTGGATAPPPPAAVTVGAWPEATSAPTPARAAGAEAEPEAEPEPEESVFAGDEPFAEPPASPVHDPVAPVIVVASSPTPVRKSSRQVAREMFVERWLPRGIQAAAVVVVLLGGLGGLAAGQAARIWLSAERARVTRALVVRTTPPGAAVTFDGVRLDGITPLAVDLPIDDGAHVVRVALRGGAPIERRVTVSADDRFVLVHENFRSAGRVVIDTQPAGARVLLDGRDAGRAPVTLDDLGTDRPHVVEARLVGYAPATATVPMERGPEHAVALTLSPTDPPGRLVVVSPLPGDVTVDGLWWGRSTAAVDEGRPAPSGLRTVVFESTAVGARTAMTVDVPAGGVVRVFVAP